MSAPEPKKFEPKVPVQLNPPKNDPISVEELSKCDVFAGKDASRALAQSSLKPEDCRAEWQDLGEKEKTVLNDWFSFFSKRYNIVGTVAGTSNL
ncbi:MAG: hypothetical protein M1835_006077 [Candelina submexicana]|nr:MAG: hypothetical protein M1835_006077 [Candelina submexicana]